MLKTLVKTEAARKFLASMGRNTDRRAYLGDPAKHQPALNFITASHTAMEAALGKLAGLVDDPTRPSDPEKNHAARIVGNKLIETLERSHSGIIATANKIAGDASAAIDAQFAPNPNRAAIEGEIRTWVRERAKAGDVAAIKEEMKGSPEVAAVVYHSPRFLLGLASDTHESFKADAVETYAPKHMDALGEALELSRVAEHYPAIVKSVKSSFYNNAVADQYRNRVEV